MSPIPSSKIDGHLALFVRAEIVRWLAESYRPFNIVKDRGFLKLMKAGRSDQWIPSPSTAARDAKTVFAAARKRISKRCSQNYSGHLHFATDCWTSPNHRAFMAVTVHRLIPVPCLICVIPPVPQRFQLGGGVPGYCCPRSLVLPAITRPTTRQ